MPDFDNLRKALLNQGEPRRVPLLEVSIDQGIKETLLGRPIDSQQAEVDFYMRAGYDFVPMIIGMRESMRGDTTSMLGAEGEQASVLKPIAPLSEEPSRVNLPVSKPRPLSSTRAVMN